MTPIAKSDPKNFCNEQVKLPTRLPPDHDTSSLPPLHIFQDIAELDQPVAGPGNRERSGPIVQGVNDSILESSKDVLEKTNRIFVWTQFTRQQMENDWKNSSYV